MYRYVHVWLFYDNIIFQLYTKLDFTLWYGLYAEFANLLKTELWVQPTDLPQRHILFMDGTQETRCLSRVTTPVYALHPWVARNKKNILI